jgi:hypothetical protein
MSAIDVKRYVDRTLRGKLNFARAWNATTSVRDSVRVIYLHVDNSPRDKRLVGIRENLFLGSFLKNIRKPVQPITELPQENRIRTSKRCFQRTDSGRDNSSTKVTSFPSLVIRVAELCIPVVSLAYICPCFLLMGTIDD